MLEPQKEYKCILRVFDNLKHSLIGSRRLSWLRRNSREGIFVALVSSLLPPLEVAIVYHLPPHHPIRSFLLCLTNPLYILLPLFLNLQHPFSSISAIYHLHTSKPSQPRLSNLSIWCTHLLILYILVTSSSASFLIQSQLYLSFLTTVLLPWNMSYTPPHILFSCHSYFT